jgi:hypothetical protein
MKLENIVVLYNNVPISTMHIKLVDRTTGEEIDCATSATIRFSAQGDSADVTALQRFVRNSDGTFAEDPSGTRLLTESFPSEAG